MLDYLTNNYFTLMLLLALVVFLLVNRGKANIPAARYFWLGIFLVLLVTITDFVDVRFSRLTPSQLSGIDPEQLRRIRVLVSASSYILLPLVIMIEVLIIAPNRVFRILCIIPTVFNTIYTGPLLPEAPSPSRSTRTTTLSAGRSA